MTLSKEQLKKAATMTFVWRKVYNCLCGECRRRVVVTAIQNQRRKVRGANEAMQGVIDNFCGTCKAKVNEILKRGE